MNKILETASIVTDTNATFEERVAVAEDLFTGLMDELNEIDGLGTLNTPARKTSRCAARNAR